MKAAPLRALAGGAIMARHFGTPPPRVLALHGWGRDSTDFAEILAGVAAVAPDLPGFGSSPPPARAWGADDYARHLQPVMSRMHTPAVVVGHSFGGRIAVCLAARFPDLVGGLVLSGAPLVRVAPPARPRLTFRLIRWGHRCGLVSDERMEAVRRKYGSRDYRAARGVMREVFVRVVNESYETQLGTLAGSVDLIWGEDDREVPVEGAAVVRRTLQEAGCQVRLQTVPGVGHDLPLRRPDVLRQAVDRMLGLTR